jgi:hypothetical protein
MNGHLNEKAIRAWQNAKGAIGQGGTAQTKEFQYSPLIRQKTKSD